MSSYLFTVSATVSPGADPSKMIIIRNIGAILLPR